MLCQNCNKKEASTHYKEVINNQMTELHLCEECAREKGFDFSSFFLANLLGGLAEAMGKPKAPPVTSKEDKVKCSQCGLTYLQFKQSGRLGCSQCYEGFKEPLILILRKIHGGITHMGKVPVGIGQEVETKREILRLKQKLDSAVKREAFEEAAKIRDQIRELQGKIGGEKE